MFTDLPEDWKELSSAAWEVRKNAVAIRTKVGAAVLVHRDTEPDLIFRGCNIEDVWKASSIHAERSAIACAVSAGFTKIDAVLIAADGALRERLTPCGGCMDFLMQFGGPAMLVMFQPAPDANIQVYTAAELMPYYPK